MSKLSLFLKDEYSQHVGRLSIPHDTKDALDDYFLRGYEPGGFITSILTNNLYGAVNSADIANRHTIYEITRWLTTNPIVPKLSWGKVELVVGWLQDEHYIRTNWVDKFEKEYIWETLKG